MAELKKILVIRLSSLGDIILSFPLLKLFKKKFPLAEIHYITKENFKEILLLNPNVDKVLSLNGSLSSLRRRLNSENYDLIIDIHKNFRSIYLSFFNKKRVVRYNKENFKKFLLVRFKINLFKKIIPVYEKYLHTIKDHLSELDYKYTTTELIFDKERLIKNSYIVISPTSRHFTKTYPKEKFVNYINKLENKSVILVGDNSINDKSICDFITSKCNNVLNLCGKLDIKSLANVLYHSDYVICNDSAILHFAEALGKKVIAIFGSTVKEFGFFPQLNYSVVLENKNLYCRPCTHIGRENCPERHFKCMLDIKLE